LEWRNVDFAAGTIRLDTSKNGKGRVLPFRALPALAALLKRQREVIDGVEREQGAIVPRVFLAQDGRTIRNLRWAWETTCKKLGMPGKLLHDFRRTAARNLIRAGVPERIAMEILGHKTRCIFDRYNIVNDRDVAEGLEKLARAQETAPKVVPFSSR
jgi:integrase